MKERLKLGTAYHSNRILRHVEEDMVDIVKHNMNVVVHMLTHNDLDRHLNVMKDVVAISEDKGLEVWLDNWGIDCGPGDKAFITGLYPEAKAMFSDGTPVQLKPCYNSPEFRAFSREWVDQVAFIGGKTIFWDEPHLQTKENYYACWCPRCRKLFEERYHRPMPAEIDADVAEFRTATIVDYFTEMTDYANSKGLINTGCIMFNPSHGISLDSIDRLLAIPHFDNVGCDPYWWGRFTEAADVYDYVYTRMKKGIDAANQYGKDHNVWVQAFGLEAGREDEVMIAYEAAYDAGARTILSWSFRGGESNNYRAANTDRIWQITGEACGRLRGRWLDEIMAGIRNR